MIRVATAADAGRIRAIEDDADSLLFERIGAVPWSSTDGQWRLDQPGFVLLAAEESGDAVGMAHVLDVTGSVHVEQLGVVREAQGRGHGRALVEAVKVEAPPTRSFHHDLEKVEQRLGLEKYGRRQLMRASLLT